MEHDIIWMMNKDIQKILLCAQQHVQAGRMLDALNDYHRAVNAAPDSIPAHYSLGVFFMQQNQLDYAQTQFKNVLALYPNHINALFYSGLLCLNNQQLDLAENLFQHILSLNSEHVQTIVNLGVIRLQRHHGQDAINYFTKALAIDEHNLEAKNNLAATFMHHDRFEAALVYYNSLLQDDPQNAEYNYNAGVAQMALGHLDRATLHFNQVLVQKNTFHSMAYNNLAAIQLRLGQRESAILLLTNALRLNPSDQSSQFMLSALTQDQQHAKTCTTYVGNLFDNYALYYDHHLKQILHSTLPEQMVEVLHQQGYVKFAQTLDLGCGTGLSGLVLREMSEQLTGVDLSEKMLAQARLKEIYDSLTCSEISSFLNKNTSAYNLIMAADVLPYMGDLEQLFQRVHVQLAMNGLFIFNIEISAHMPWQLQDNIRFSHHQNYIHELCTRNQFNLIVEKKTQSRQHEHKILTVMLYVFERVNG